MECGEKDVLKRQRLLSSHEPSSTNTANTNDTVIQLSPKAKGIICRTDDLSMECSQNDGLKTQRHEPSSTSTTNTNDTVVQLFPKAKAIICRPNPTSHILGNTDEFENDKNLLAIKDNSNEEQAYKWQHTNRNVDTNVASLIGKKNEETGTSIQVDIMDPYSLQLHELSAMENCKDQKRKNSYSGGRYQCRRMNNNTKQIINDNNCFQKQQHLENKVKRTSNNIVTLQQQKHKQNQKHTLPNQTQKIKYCKTDCLKHKTTVNNCSYCWRKMHMDLAGTQYITKGAASVLDRIRPYYNHLGQCKCICRYCGAMFWESEKVASASCATNFVYNKCYYGGRIVLRPPPEYPAYIKQLYSDTHFMDNIRAYNQMFSMTSLGANVDNSINNGKGPYVFRVSGQIYHWIGSLCPDEGQQPRFLQLYIHDTTNEVKNQMSHFTNEDGSRLKEDVVAGLIELLDSHNALVQLFRTARNKYMDADIPEFKIRLYNVIGTRQYELPTTETVGAIVFGQSFPTENDFDIIIEEHSRFPQRVNKLHPAYMSLQFPLLFIYGEDGYQKDMKLADVPGKSTKGNKRMSMNMYYLYQIHDRLNQFNLLPRGGKLFQQYVVTAYCAIEQSRLDYIRQIQNDIRNEYLSGIYDAIVRGDRDGSNLGLRTVLTASFTGGPRYMYAHYLDALAICRVHGSPSFFITFTCNAKWPEIEKFMEYYPQLTTADRADIVTRIFEQKVQDYINFVCDSNTFGNVTAVLYTIEFQKRGLPHCHSLLWIDDMSKVHEDVDVDKYISAELPDPLTDADGYMLISELMMHGPCGYANKNASCMKDGDTCNRNFPKAYCSKTYIDTDGFVHYRRRDSGVETQRQNVWLDNRYVVPYNKTLCMRYYAHINVEYCGWNMLIKYLFKYISKGTDRVIANVTRPVADVPTTTNIPAIQVDEIKNYVEARYIGPHEACWRIFYFPIHYRNPPVQTLAVHLENMQQITFRSKDNLQSLIANPTKKNNLD